MSMGRTRRLMFEGREGRFVDASGATIRDVGPWRLRSEQDVQSLGAFGDSAPQRIFGIPTCTLVSVGQPSSQYFAGVLSLPGGAVQMRLELLEWHINLVEPEAARQALSAAIGD